MLFRSPRDTALYRTYGGLGVSNVNIISGFKMAWSPTIAVLTGHSYIVYCIAFSADGSRLASASVDRTIRLWDGRTGYHIMTLKGHTDPVNSVSFSPRNSVLASASADNTIRLWGSRTGRHVSTLTGHCGAVLCVTFSADGSRLASGSSDKSVRLWDGGTGDCIAIFRDYETVHSVAFSPDGLMLALASLSNVKLWDVQTRRRITLLTTRLDGIASVAFLSGGSRLAAASSGGSITAHNVGLGPPSAVQIGYGNAPLFIASSPDGLRLASGSRDGTVQVWDGTGVASVTTLGRHSASVKSVAFSPDGSRLASASCDHTVRL